MKNRNNDEIEIDLRTLLLELKAKALLIALITVVSAALAFWYSAFVLQPVYTSSTMVYVLNKETTLTSLTDLQLGTQLTKDYKVLIVSRPVLDAVVDHLGLGIDYETMKGMVTIDNPTDTRILSISIEHTDPVMAKTIADELADVSCARIAEIMNVETPKVVEAAYLPLAKSGPSVTRYTALGAAAGAAVSIFLIALMFLLNETIASEEDVEKYLGLGTLAVIPLEDAKHTAKRARKTQKPGIGDSNAGSISGSNAGSISDGDAGKAGKADTTSRHGGDSDDGSIGGAGDGAGSADGTGIRKEVGHSAT
ncbi:MAG: polysaccharide export protein [Lachnospiraceae bacterium]|jgi:capsular polysaccharide biosynthesis protein|nr:polysaccharide export protein [Lachnospiraceae bacterium]